MSLKTRFQNKKIVVMPGVYDGLTASLAEAAGFRSALLKRGCCRLYPPGET
jgi:2-methylisocitrate lyase-like PEP mutase family enzyme